MGSLFRGGVTRLGLGVATRLGVPVARLGLGVVTRLGVPVARLGLGVVTRLGVPVARLGLGVVTRLGVRMATLAGTLLLVASCLVASCSASPSTAGPSIPPQPPPADGFDAGVFTLGVLLNPSGPSAEADQIVLAGMQAYWAGVNARGGIAGVYAVELSVWDGDMTVAREGGGVAVGSGGDDAVARGGDGVAVGSGGDDAVARGGGGVAVGSGAGDAVARGGGGVAVGSGAGDAVARGGGGVAVGLDGGDAVAREGGDGPITLEEWDIAALAYVHSGIDAARLAAGEPLPAVPAVATLGGEDLDWVLTAAAPVELTTVALLDRFGSTGPGATWCVIVDSSPLGRQVASVAYAAGAAPDTVPATLDLDVGEIEVLDLDASVFDIADAVTDRQCRYVLVETAESRAIDVLDRLPANLTVIRRSTLAADRELPGQVELLIDPAPPWLEGRSGVMDAFAADWSSFAADTQPDSRVRAGWLSQLRLHALLEEAAAGGDVSRERLVELSGQIEPVDLDRNTLPGVPRVGMDISETIGGGPLRTLRLYGRSDIGADELGLRQVLVVDVTNLVEELRDRLGTLR